MAPLRILVVDDHEAVRRGIRSVLSSRADWLICGEAADGLEAIEKARRLHPDVVIMDISLPVLNGLEATTQVRQILPDTEVLIVTQYDTPEMVQQALCAGARGYVLKFHLSADLIPAIEAVSAQRSSFSSPILAMAGAAMDNDHSAAPAAATRPQSGRAEQEALVRMAIRASRTVAWSWDLRTGEVSSSENVEQLLGLPSQVSIATAWQMVHPDDLERLQSVVTQSLAEHVDYETDFRLVRPTDGSVLWLQLRAKVERDAAGEPSHIIGVVTDITARKLIEQALAEKAHLLDLSSDAVIVRDLRERITYWNQGAAEMYGYTRGEALGRRSHELLQTEFPDPLERIRDKLRRDGSWSGELAQARKDGTKLIVSSRWTLVSDAKGELVSVLEINRDITEHQQDEEKLRKSEERYRNLAATLEAQIRERTKQLEQRNAELLAQSEKVRGLASRLLQAQEEERRRISRDLHDSAGQTLTLLSMLLSRLARNLREYPPWGAQAAESLQLAQQLSQEIRTASYLLHPPLLDETGLVGSLRWYLQGFMKRSGLKIRLLLPEDFGRLPAEMELVLFRIIQESLTNIHRHAESKNAVIRISREQGKVLLDIVDHGKGMLPQEIAALDGEGVGVGIRGMRERVRQFQGRLSIESDARGTRISVVLPIPPQPQPPVPDRAAQASA
jgi:PAS domain S-box-containing protein